MARLFEEPDHRPSLPSARRPRLRHPLPTLLLTLSLSGCTGGGLVGLDDPSFDSDMDGILNGVDACPEEPETLNRVFDSDGCPDALTELYEAIREDLEEYWANVLPDFGESYRPIGIFTAFTTPTTTGCGGVYPQNVEYCSRGEAVYYDEEMIGAALEVVGTMGPAFIISHAIGGHISWILEWALWLEPVTLRLQADCWGGVWAGDATARGWLEVDTPVEAVRQLVSLQATPGTWFDERKYGRPDQRTAAFVLGFMDGPVGCTRDAFFDIYPD